MSEDGKVVSILNWPIPKAGEPDQGVINVLENALASARRGEVDGVAVAMSRPNDRVNVAYYFGSATFRLVAAVHWLQVSLDRDIEASYERAVPDDG